MLPRGRPCCCLPARPGSGYRGRLTLGDWESHDEQVTGTASLAVEQRAIHAEKLFRRAINHERAEAPRQGRPFDMAKLAAAAISLGIAILVSGQFRPETRRASGSPRPALRGADRACTPPGRLFEAFVANCPLRYTSPNAPKAGGATENPGTKMPGVFGLLFCAATRASAMRGSWAKPSGALCRICSSYGWPPTSNARSAYAPASPSRGPGNGILRAETGGRFRGAEPGRTVGIRFADRAAPR